MTRDEAAGVVIAKVLSFEGGVKDVGDGKGITRFGQTPQWLADFGLPTPETAEAATANYRTWLVRTRLIGLCDQADVFATAVIDFAVHAGHGPAIRRLQIALRVRPDGVFGPETQAAVDRADRFAMACRVIAERERFNGRVITDHPEKAAYAAGWGNRQAAFIEALAS